MEESDDDSTTDAEDAPKSRDNKGKGKAKESSEQQSGRKILAVPTGREYEVPCSSCAKKGLGCSINISGGSCVPCRFSKRKCDKAQPRRMPKKMTGKFVESDGEETGPDNDPTVPKPMRRVRRKVPGKTFIYFLTLLFIVSISRTQN
jgi:hypothetical protein